MQDSVEKALFKLAEVAELTTLRPTLIYKLMREGQFPKQLKFGARRIAWRVTEINEFISGKRDWA
jgi:prophage regulatory protein